MELLVSFSNYLVIAVAIIVSVVLSLKAWERVSEKKHRTYIQMEQQKIAYPLRLQAYERLCLLLERISPDSMLVRLQRPGMSAIELQSELLSAIRVEFEHNLSQQVYVSADVWNALKLSRNQLIVAINTAGDKVTPDAPAVELSRFILQEMMGQNESAITLALELLRREVTT